MRINKSLAPTRPDILAELITQGLITPRDEAQVRLTASHVGKPPEQIAVELGLALETDIIDLIARAGGYQVWRSGDGYDKTLLGMANRLFLQNRLVLPIAMHAGRLRLAMADPFDQASLTAAQFAFGAEVSPMVASATDIRSVLNTDAGVETQSGRRTLERDLETLADATATSPAAVTLQSLIVQALERRASDIHIEPRPRGAQVRLRVDGSLIDHSTLDADIAQPILSRTKVLADLNIAESRLPQDGRMTVAVRGAPIDIRVATTPTVHGEALTLRLLGRAGELRTLNALGLQEREARLLARAFNERQGLFLVSGPTGSGKTTTLYAGIESLKHGDLKILSIEDPVELQFDHVVQIQAAPQIGLTFATALRSILRHDPDVILIGEIRDTETAQIAVQASLTGHLVLASIHARDAIRATSRLLDMGVEPYQLAAALIGSMAQRLLRKLCVCSTPLKLDTEQQAALRRFNFELTPSQSWRRPRGCEKCGGSGYSGRCITAEAFLVDDAITAALARNAPLDVLSGHIAQNGFRPLAQDGFNKAAMGITSLSEVLAVAAER